jgi:hypothetical protein
VRFRRHRGRPVRAGTLGLALAGGVLIGVGAAAMIAADLGVTPWDVLTTAVADRADVTVGVAGAALSIAVYLACAPFGRLPGWGNLVLLVAVAGAVDAALATFGDPDALAGRLALYGARGAGGLPRRGADREGGHRGGAAGDGDAGGHRPVGAAGGGPASVLSG